MRTVVLDETGAVPDPVRRAVIRTLRDAARSLDVGAGDVAVRFVGAESMRELNRRWRQRDRPTDVLSFPSGVVAPDGRRHIGDVAICLDVVPRQGAPLERKAAQLALHGLLHLLGYDHETDDGEMDRLERRLRRALLSAS